MSGVQAQRPALVRRLLETAFAQHERVSVGRVRPVGEGLSHRVFAAFVEFEPDPGGHSGAYVVSLPGWHDDPAERRDPRREALLLAQIAASTSAIRVPGITAVLPVEGGDAVVRTYLEGSPLDLRAGRQPSVRPWEVVGEVAATIHGIDLARVPDLPGPVTRRAHALAQVAALGSAPALREVVQWVEAHLPPDEPASLLHGDLLGQNLLLHPSEPTGVLDWEYAMRGDPAYDLAIVTRGARQPFQTAGGLALLLAAYAARASQHVTACEVHLHELCIVGRWYREAIEGTNDREPPAQALARVRGVLARARAAEARERQAQGR